MVFKIFRPITLGLLLIFGVPTARVPARQTESPRVSCDHGGNDLWEVLRLRPVQFTEFDGNIAYWKYQDDYNVKYGSFVLLDNAKYVAAKGKEVPVDYVKKRKGLYWLCAYCSVCQALLKAYEGRTGS